MTQDVGKELGRLGERPAGGGHFAEEASGRTHAGQSPPLLPACSPRTPASSLLIFY